MTIIKKEKPKNFREFSWLDYDYLPNSECFKLELYFNPSDDLVKQSVIFFNSLFGNFLDNILIKNFGINTSWGDFCIDTWDIENDRYDYSAKNKEEPTASYLTMLMDNQIEPEYSGFCRCLNWDKFLYITFNCVIHHTAPYSMMFYVPNDEFVFYFHHSGSFGIYYKELNASLRTITNKIKSENLEIRSANDERVILQLSI